MNLKFHDDRGNEALITDVATFTDFVERGKIRPETLVFNRETSLWSRADEYEQYSAAMTEIHARRLRQADTPPYGAPRRGPDEINAISGRPWLSLLAAAVVLFAFTMLVVASVAFSSGAEAVGFRIGTALGYSLLWAALPAFLIWRFALGKKRGTGLMIFACGFFVICSYQSFAAFAEARNGKKATDDMALMMRDAMSGKLIDPKSIDAGTYGNATPMMKVIAEYAAQTQTDFLRMNEEMTALDIQKLLAPETLQDVSHIDAGQRRLQSLLELLDRYDELFRKRTDEMPARVEQSEMSSQSKREFLAGFNERKAAGLKQVSDFFEIERNFVSKTDELYNFVRARQRLYRIAGSEIQFDSQRDADIYNGLLGEIDAIAKQEDDWRTRISQSGEAQLDKMERETGPRF